MKRYFILFAICVFLIQLPSDAKKKILPEKMPETKQEWSQKAQNINLEDRKIQPYSKPEDKEFKPIEPYPKKFEKYNVAPGEKEVNLTKIKKLLDIKSQAVIEPKFKYMAYGEYYYAPLCDQISSDIFVQEMKTGFSRLKRTLDTTILNTKRTPAITTGTKELRENMFSTLTIVDWSKDSQKLLVKEKIGSTLNGIYRTYVWIYYMPTNDLDGFSYKYEELNDAIKIYWGKKDYIALDNYRWDIKPLGFSAENPDCVVVESFAWDKKNEKIFLGVWSIDTKNGKISLLSEKPQNFELSLNGLVVKEYLP